VGEAQKATHGEGRFIEICINIGGVRFPYSALFNNSLLFSIILSSVLLGKILLR
jgi:hypothetical protein